MAFSVRQVHREIGSKSKRSLVPKTSTIHDTPETLHELTPTDVDDDGDLGTGEDDDGDIDLDDADIANARASSVASANAGDNDDGACFPADASAELEDESLKSNSGLNVGHHVKVAPGVCSDMFMFMHKMSSVEHEFVTLTTLHWDVLSTTTGHYIYINNKVAAAHAAKVGESVICGDGSTSPIMGVRREIKTGFYNLQTAHGDTVVSNVRTSTFT